MADIAKTPLKELVTLIKSKELTCEEVMKSTLNNIKNYDNVIQAYISLEDENKLISLAKESDKRWQSGKQLSNIDGLPVAVKDNIHSLGLETTCASNILHGYNPVFDATAVASIKEKGGIIIGKTNLDEFAMGSTTENSSLQQTKNPWDINKVPGGSSGGSAAAVAAGLAPLALGSDTGGSVRQPAAFCGVVGIKPTYGLISRYGLVSYASSLDQIGTLANDVYGAATLLSMAAKGDDKNDSTSLGLKPEDYTANLDNDIKGKKIAIIPELLGEGISKGVKENFNKSLDLLKSLGAIVEEVNFESLEYVISTYYFIATAEASSNLSRYDGVKYGYRGDNQKDFEEMLHSTRTDGFGREVKKRIILGNFVLSSGYYDAYYKKSQKIRTKIMNEFKTIFENYDAIIMPTTPDTALEFGASEKDPLKLYLADITTVLPNLAGLPAISVPSGLSDNMPVGMQFIGKPLSEKSLLNIAYQFEQKTGFTKSPDLSKLKGIKVEGKGESKKVKKTKEFAIYTPEYIKEISNSYKNKEGKTDRVLCTDLEEYVGKTAKVKGTVYKLNNLGGIEFYILRDRTGYTQLVLEGEAANNELALQSVVEVEGKITKEDRSAYNNIEVKVEKITILSKAASDIPINVGSNLANINLPTLLDNRAVSLKNEKILSVFKIQAEIVNSFSTFLKNNGFTEIKTPKIIAQGTEGGSNIFAIKYFDKEAFLAQSPQFYKQMMVGTGLERVFEVGPVFRAEKHNTVRHLNEYTSLDFEMGYIEDEQDIIDTHEALLKYTLANIKTKYSDVLEEFGVDLVIPEKFVRIHFLEALDICEAAGLKDMDGDISPEGEKVICRHFEEKENNPFVYIVGYPVPKRPMYTMEDERLRGYTRSFDLIYKGLEITTGGQRIHNYDKLKQNIIEFGGNPKTVSDYLAAFKYGMPPHGGLGMGLERLTMKLLGLSNVREATLFPRDIGRLTP